jgi:GTP-binding protein
LQRPALAVLVALVDVRRGLQQEDEQLLELIAQKPLTSRAPVEVILVATKLDKLPGSQRKLAMNALKQTTPRPWLGVSTELPETQDALWRKILKLLELDQPSTATASPAEGEPTAASMPPASE